MTIKQITQLCALSGALLLPTPLLAADWVIHSLNGAPALPGGTISFDDDGNVSGSTGCNRFTTTGTLEDGQLTLNPAFPMTKMACEDNMMAQEDALVELLTGSIAVSGNPFTGEMILTGVNHQITLLPAPVE